MLDLREEATLVTGDFTGLEIGVQGEWGLRLWKRDRQLLDMYLAQAQGRDIHCLNAIEVFGKWLKWTVPLQMERLNKETKKLEKFTPEYAGENVGCIPVEKFKKHPFGKVVRDLIKTIWYGFAYGKRGYGFATLKGADGKMIGEQLADEMCEALMDYVPITRKWPEWVEEYVLEHRGIYSLGGRWCPLYNLIFSGAPQWMIKKAIRRALNFPMQASGADIIGDAMIRVGNCPELAELCFRIVLQVHDELVLRGPLRHVERAKVLLKNHMEASTANGTKLLIPLQVTVGHAADYHAAK